MENEDADKNDPKPLSFEDMDDIRDIDSEDTSQDTSPSTSENVTVIHRIPFVGDHEKGNRGLADGIDDEIKSTVDSTVSGRAITSEGTLIKDDKLDCDSDKIKEVSSCSDDTHLNPLISANGGDQSQECITHSFSFVLKPATNKEEMDSNVGESKMADSEALQDTTLKLKTKTKKVKKAGNKDSRDSDSSVSSKKRSKSGKTRIKSKFAPGSFEYIEEGLQSRIFSGWIEERKWVENLVGYRDVIEVDEWEVEMNQALMAIIRSVPGVLEGKKWINITPPSEREPCYRIWTLLATPPIPGHYWFSISGVAVHPQFGLRVMVRQIRSIHPHDGELASARRKRRKELSLRGPGQELETLNEQVQDWLQQLRQISLSSVWAAISSTLTISNIREAIRFVIVLSMTIVVGLVAFVRESHHYGIQFLHAAGVFFRNITPFLQSLLAFAEKIIGGMYLLIAMVYKDFRRSSAGPPPPPYPMIGRPPMAIGGGQGFGPTPTGPRTVKYVPPEQWVYKSQNTSSVDS